MKPDEAERRKIDVPLTGVVLQAGQYAPPVARPHV
jgi:hypothetical protein